MSEEMTTVEDALQFLATVTPTSDDNIFNFADQSRIFTLEAEKGNFLPVTAAPQFEGPRFAAQLAGPHLAENV